MNTEEKLHWDNVYSTKAPQEVSWTQEVPKTSLDFIENFHLPKSASIIDIGGGDSKLVDFLLEEGYTDITVLDISAKALERAKVRLGDKAIQVQWIVSDITTFKPERQYNVWHDRATFHFLTTSDQITSYLKIARQAINGYIVIGTFSKTGPIQCSGLDIKQYSEQELEISFANGFKKLNCIQENHATPFNTIQNFTFCAFKSN